MRSRFTVTFRPSQLSLRRIAVSGQRYYSWHQGTVDCDFGEMALGGSYKVYCHPIHPDEADPCSFRSAVQNDLQILGLLSSMLALTHAHRGRFLDRVGVSIRGAFVQCLLGLSTCWSVEFAMEKDLFRARNRGFQALANARKAARATAQAFVDSVSVSTKRLSESA